MARIHLSDQDRKALRGPDIPPTPVNQPHPAMHLPAKYVRTLEYNQKLNLCCRHVEESGHTAQWFATPTAEKTNSGETVPDILVITCGACGRRHRRFMVGAGSRQVIKEVR